MKNKVFISYSHHDVDWLNRLKPSLKLILQKNDALEWSDTDIAVGEKWNDQIMTAINESKLAILLVSPYFLASDFIMDVELPLIIQLEKKYDLKIAWVCLSACLFTETSINDYQCTHNPQFPLDSLSVSEQNALLVKICRKIKDILNTANSSNDSSNEIKKEKTDIHPDNWGGSFLGGLFKF
jgi:TIR domain